MALEPGTRLGPYEIIELRGKGGMGEVYRARDTRLDRDVAVKVLPAELSEDETYRKRLEREAKTISQLQHPNVCMLLDVGSEGGTQYLVMEYLEGETLADRLRTGALPIHEVLRIGGEIAEAIEAAHRRGIVHRDLKPGNVMLTETGTKVLDFGLAKASKGPSTEPDAETETLAQALTKEGRIVGTMPYMAPEQLKGNPADSRTDIWALGCVLYEMATGGRPFQGESQADLITSIMGSEPEPPSRNQPLTPEGLDHVVGRCLEKDPERRWHSAKDLSLELESLEDGSPPSEESKGKHRLWRLVAMAALVVVAVVAGAVWLPGSDPTDSVEVASPVIAERPTIIVLPLRNLGEEANGFFATGMTEDITSSLARLDELAVIDRGVAAQNAAMSISDLREELGVDWVLTGSVQWASEKIRIRLALTRTEDSIEVWTPSWDRVIEDVLALQSEIAEQVSQQLEISISGRREQTGLSSVGPAVEAYLRGLAAKARLSEGKRDYELQVEMFQRAVDLDPEFALAHAALGRAHGALFMVAGDRRTVRIELARSAAREALRLDPDLPEAKMALGAAYFSAGEWAEAFPWLEAAVAGMPSDGEVRGLLSYLHWRSGDPQAGLEHSLRAIEITPRSSEILGNLGMLYMYLRDYEEAERCLGRALELAPDNISAHALRAWNSSAWKGVAAAKLEGWPETSDPGPIFRRFRTYLKLGELDKAREQIDLFPAEGFVDQFGFEPRSVLMARWHEARGESDLARDHYDSAREVLEAHLGEQPEDDRALVTLGLAYAKLGRSADAIRAAERGNELGGIDKDAVTGPGRLSSLAQTYALVGEHDLAVAALRELLEHPNPFSVLSLEEERNFDSLRDHPGYRSLMDDYGR